MESSSRTRSDTILMNKNLPTLHNIAGVHQTIGVLEITGVHILPTKHQHCR